MSVTRIFVEKKPGFDVEAKHIQTDLTENLGVKGIEELRLLHRYDVEGLSQEEQEDADKKAFAERVVEEDLFYPVVLVNGEIVGEGNPRLKDVYEEIEKYL